MLEAGTILQDTVERRRRVFGRAHPRTVEAEAHLICVYGKFADVAVSAAYLAVAFAGVASARAATAEVFFSTRAVALRREYEIDKRVAELKAEEQRALANLDAIRSKRQELAAEQRMLAVEQAKVAEAQAEAEERAAAPELFRKAMYEARAAAESKSAPPPRPALCVTTNLAESPASKTETPKTPKTPMPTCF